MQYTIRNIPEALDNAIRERAKQEGKSLNDVVVQALRRAMGFSKDAVKHRDLSDLAGTWKEDPQFDQAIADQHAIDESIWK
jgi:plasmid stability protein